MIDPNLDPNLQPEANDLPHRAQDAWSDASNRAEHAMEDGVRYARENPIVAVVGAIIAGIVIALLVSSRREPTVRERYIDGPLDDIHDHLSNLREQVGEKADKHFHKTVSAIERAIKQARKALS